MKSIGIVLLALVALMSVAAALYLWIGLGSGALPPITLLLLIALTCVLRIITLRR